MSRTHAWFGRFLLLVFIAAVTGCAQDDRHAPSSWESSGFRPSLPNEAFTTYESAFRYIAACEGLSQDRTALFELAADSTLDRMSTAQTGDLIIVRSDHYGRSRFGWRGAQGQGRYYVFRVANDRWQLVGILHGNNYRWNNVGERIQIVTRWHMSVDESPEIAYTWNGTLFE